MFRAFLAAAAFWLCALPFAAHAQPAPRPAGPILVELYTSQSCAECWSANRLVGQLAREQDVIALTFSVDYWNYLGWRDTFSQRAFSQRQRAFGRALRARGLMTPDVIVNGVAHVRGARAEPVRDLIAQMRAAPTAPAPRIAIRQLSYRARVEITAPRAPIVPADIWAVAFDPGPIMQTVGSGDNAGRNVPHYNLVRSIERIGYWEATRESFSGVLCRRACAIIIQAPNGGPVLASAVSIAED
ncbi:MAG: DUF1223 domain-containing protein [Hyphomonadaceae bacterium]